MIQSDALQKIIKRKTYTYLMVVQIKISVGRHYGRVILKTGSGQHAFKSGHDCFKTAVFPINAAGSAQILCMEFGPQKENYKPYQTFACKQDGKYKESIVEAPHQAEEKSKWFDSISRCRKITIIHAVIHNIIVDVLKFQRYDNRFYLSANE